jgi:L-cysteine/cystine lyase
MPDIDWQALRATFPITARCIYLNTGWSGPSARATVAAMQARLEREAYDGPTTLEVRHEKGRLVRRVRQAFADLIGADLDEVALTYTTTEGVNTVLRGIGLGAGDHVITCNLEHNAVMVPSYMARQRDGVQLTIVRLRPEDSESQVFGAFAAAMTPKTKLLVLSHVSYNRGTRLPMRQICEMAHRQGALVVVDAAQSAGQIAFDVRELGCDFLALPGHKWLLGPDGAAALYVRRDLIERLQPLAVVHGANRRYDFEGNFEYANDSIHKFELTTHSGPVLAGLERAMAAVAEIGVAVIEHRCMALVDRFIAGIANVAGVRITTPLDTPLRSGIVTFTVGDLNPSETAAALYHQWRIVTRVCNDRRVRACFHIFNDESDADALVEAVTSLANSGLPAGTMSEAEYKATLLESED